MYARLVVCCDAMRCGAGGGAGGGASGGGASFMFYVVCLFCFPYVVVMVDVVVPF